MQPVMCTYVTYIFFLVSGSGTIDVSRAMVIEVMLVDLGGAGQAAHEPCAFLDAPARTISSFDWSDLISVLNSEAFLDADHTGDECLFVDVPRVRFGDHLFFCTVMFF